MLYRCLFCVYAMIRVGLCWNLTFQLFVFFALLLAAAGYSCGHYYYACVDHRYACLVMMYARMRCVCSVYVQPRYNSNRTASLCGPLVCVCWHCIFIRLCDMRALDTSTCGMCYCYHYLLLHEYNNVQSK